jgi:hypothetical protein
MVVPNESLDAHGNNERSSKTDQFQFRRLCMVILNGNLDLDCVPEAVEWHPFHQ